MRRIALIAAVLGLGLAGTALGLGLAEARRHLTLHRARVVTAQVARWDMREGIATRYRILECGRVDGVRAWCLLREWGDISQVGSPPGRGDQYVDLYEAAYDALRVTRQGDNIDWF